METLSDGTPSWIGGMDSSRSPIDISDYQYSRACNVMIPRSLGGIKVRHGIHHSYIHWQSGEAKSIFSHGHIKAEGWFKDKHRFYLIVVVDGYVFKFTPWNKSTFYGEILNLNDPNDESPYSWVIRVPFGCIVTNGVNLPLYVTSAGIRRTNPDNNELNVCRMGKYIQNRLFYSNQSGSLILASDFQNPVGTSEQTITGILGFAPPEDYDVVTAIGKQKVMLDYAEGGSLLFSTRTNIYSVDVRGDRNSWANLNSRVGKVTQTVEGLSASSSYSFESFGTNIYFRNFQFGIADLRQSQYQFNRLDGVVSEAIEASYWLDQDTDWLLDKCYSRSWNSRLFTTVSPEKDDDGRVYWNGIVSFHPSAVYSNQQAAPRRYECLITGVRPWAMTSVDLDDEEDRLFIWSYDKDGINRLYEMAKNKDYDINHEGKRVEIEGWIETKGYDFKQRYALKKERTKFYTLRDFRRNINLSFFARTQEQGQWVRYFQIEHKVAPGYIVESNGAITPIRSRPQTRSQVNMPSADFGKCGVSESFLWIQDRIEFTGPIHIDALIRVSVATNIDTSVFKESEQRALEYDYKNDFGYSIIDGKQIK